MSCTSRVTRSRRFPSSRPPFFGSFAREEQTASSDIDFLVAFEDGSRIEDVERTREALERATGRQVDIVTTLEGQTSRFRESILKDGVKVYG